MFTGLGIALKLFFGGLLKRLIALFGWLIDNPAVLAAILCLVGGLLLGYGYRDRAADKEIATLEKKIKDAEERAETEAGKIKAESAQRVAELEASNQALRLGLLDFANNYQRDLGKALKDQKIVVVKATTPSGKPLDLMFENDKHVCDAFPSTYTDTVNRMVQKTKESLK